MKPLKSYYSRNCDHCQYVAASLCISDMSAASPPMSRKSLLLPSRRTDHAEQQQFRQTVRFQDK